MLELLSGHNVSDVPHDYQLNLEELLKKINFIRAAWNKPMLVTSGFRSEQDHLRIYSVINAKRKEKDLDPITPPMGSAHLKGAAVDISDPDGSLMKWTKANETLLETVGLWVEDENTQTRVHFQIYAPHSGRRFFKP